MDAAPHLEYIMTVRGGIENIDIEGAEKRGIKVIHCPAHNAIAVAEYTIGLILCEMRNIVRSDKALRQGTWREQYPNSAHIGELCTSVVGLVGLGTIGALVAERLRPFGAKIISYDPYVSQEEMNQYGVEKVELQELLQSSDIVSLHGRVPPEAPALIGKKELDAMKPSAYLINTARAALIDMDELELAIKTNIIMGAAIDVFPKEPIDKDAEILLLDNISFTNHRGGDTHNSYALAPALLVEQLKEYMQTGKSRYLISG